MLKFTCAVMCIFALCRIGSAGDTPLTKHEKAAIEFTFEKLKIGTTIEDFNKMHPGQEPVKSLSDKSINLFVYIVSYNDDAVSGVYNFVDGKLFYILIIYNDSAIDKLGGIGVLSERLVAKLGKVPGEDIINTIQPKKIQVSWKLKSINRLIEMTSPPIGLDDRPNWVSVTVIDTKQQAKINSTRRAKAKTGFDD